MRYVQDDVKDEEYTYTPLNTTRATHVTPKDVFKNDAFVQYKM